MSDDFEPICNTGEYCRSDHVDSQTRYILLAIRHTQFSQHPAFKYAATGRTFTIYTTLTRIPVIHWQGIAS